ncbi:MAG: alpha/beta fold hydrolase [Alphaproteobacteria bacterium]
MAQNDNPEIGKFIQAAGIETNYHDLGSGAPLLLLHGSGPGVSAFANWRLNMNELAENARVIAPDMVGFGFTERPENVTYSMENWVAHAIGLMDALGLDQVDVVGNSFGGGLALALGVRHPQRIRRLVLMGAAGLEFELTKGLDDVWGYTPSIDYMRKILDIMAYDRSLVTDELAEIRYKATMREGIQEAYASMFPAPRQRWIKALAQSEDDVAALKHRTLILHGRDDQVIPVQNSIRLNQLISDSQLHVFGKCGHWTQIEQRNRFNRLVRDFVAED